MEENKNALTTMETLISLKKGIRPEDAQAKKAEFSTQEQFFDYIKALPEPLLLFFDTETTGLPKDYTAPIKDYDKWPRLVQLAWELYDSSGKCLERTSDIIFPEGFEIPEAASNIHRITTARAKEEGKPLVEVLRKFHTKIKQSGVLVGHNINFDNKIVGAELIRLHFPNVKPPRLKICTMMSTIKYCRILSSNRFGFKWPKLVELHKKLFGCDFDGAHDAGFDVAATAKCFFELRKLGVL